MMMNGTEHKLGYSISSIVLTEVRSQRSILFETRFEELDELLRLGRQQTSFRHRVDRSDSTRPAIQDPAKRS